MIASAFEPSTTNLELTQVLDLDKLANKLSLYESDITSEHAKNILNILYTNHRVSLKLIIKDQVNYDRAYRICANYLDLALNTN
jgi:hypothetical protein